MKKVTVTLLIIAMLAMSAASAYAQSATLHDWFTSVTFQNIPSTTNRSDADPEGVTFYEIHETDMVCYADPDHPDFCQLEWAKEQGEQGE